MKTLITFALLALSPLSAFAIESGSTTLRCEDASGDADGIYISYGNDWINDGSSTTTVDFTGWGTEGKRFVVTTQDTSDSKDMPKGVVAIVSLEAPSYSKDNTVDISYKGDQFEFVLTVRRQDIHRDSYDNLPNGGDDFHASYSFPATATMTDTGDSGFNKPVVSKMKCRAKSGMHGMAG